MAHVFFQKILDPETERIGQEEFCGLLERTGALDGNSGCLLKAPYYIASDHSPYALADKEAGYEDIFRATLGLNIIQVMLPAIVGEAAAAVIIRRSRR